jgi:hypothetical protein
MSFMKNDHSSTSFPGFDTSNQEHKKNASRKLESTPGQVVGFHHQP